MEDYPRTLMEFEQRFSSEEACREYLVQLRWPDGIRCPECETEKMWAMSRGLYHCIFVHGVVIKRWFCPAPFFRIPSGEEPGQQGRGFREGLSYRRGGGEGGPYGAYSTAPGRDILAQFLVEAILITFSDPYSSPSFSPSRWELFLICGPPSRPPS